MMTLSDGSAAWGGRYAPLVPRVLRSQWSDDPLPSPLASLFLSDQSTWGDLDARVWKYTTSEPKIVEKMLLGALSARLRREMADIATLGIFPEQWPPSIDVRRISLRARTRNVLRNAGIESEPIALQTLTIGDVLDLPGAGVVTLLDFACSLECAIELSQSTWAIADLSRQPWWKSLTLPDPRFSPFVIGASAGSMADLGAKGSLFLTRDAASGLKDEVDRVAALGFSDAISDFVVSVVPDWDDDRVVALLMRFGFEDAASPALEQIADLLSLTRERIRQLETALKKKVADCGPRPFLPKLDEALRILASAAPIAVSAAQAELAVLDSKPVHAAAVIRAAEFFGRHEELHVVKIDGTRVVVRSDQLHVFEGASAILIQARRQEQRYGAGNLSQLRWVLEAEGLEYDEDDLGLILGAAPSANMDDEGWFWFAVSGGHNSFVSTSRKILAVNSPLSIGCLRDGLRRRAAFRQRHIVPPKAVMRRLYADSPSFVFEDVGGGLVSLADPLDPELVLGPVQLAMVRILQSAPQGILNRETFMERCHAAGLNMSTVGVYTTYDPCIEHVAPNVWAARGTSVGPAVLDAFLEVAGTREAPLRETGWLRDGRPWMAFEVNATLLGSPAIPTPKDLKALLVGRDFEAKTSEGVSCGRITTDVGGAFVYGWHTFMRTAGADIGDFVKATFGLIDGVVTLELGGPELLPL